MKRENWRFYVSRFTFHAICQPLLFIGFTAIFIGYLSVWLPGPAAGLSFLGVELGEWVKFLGVKGSRDLFYLPPITLGVMLALTTVTWENGRFQTWLMRGLAVLVSFLAFPAIEDITGASQHEYLLRVFLIGLVALVAGTSGLGNKIKKPAWILLVCAGLVGAILPTWMYWHIRPFVGQVIGLKVGVGIGVWLNGLGHGLVTAISLLQMRDWRLEIQHR